MPVDFFFTKTEEELLAILKTLENALAKGSVISASAAGVSSSRQPMTQTQVEQSILRVQFSLHCKNSGVYSNPYITRIQRTSANYTT